MRTVTSGAACSLDGFIAPPDGSMDWLHWSKDVQEIMSTYWATIDTMLMGRKTWESLPERFRPLPNRRNIVITRNPDYLATGAEVFGSIAAAHAACRNSEKFFIIGGGELYKLAINDADSLELTEIHQAFDGDAYFPDFPRDQWQQVFRDCHRSESGLDFDFATYVRR